MLLDKYFVFKKFGVDPTEFTLANLLLNYYTSTNKISYSQTLIDYHHRYQNLYSNGTVEKTNLLKTTTTTIKYQSVQNGYLE